MSKAKCPKCGRKFKSGRGLPAHVEACEGKPAKAPRKERKPRRKATARARTHRTPKPGQMSVEIALNSSVVERLKAAKGDLEAKAAALGRMIEELGEI